MLNIDPDMPKEDGYELWLRYRLVDDPDRIIQYCEAIRNVVILGESEKADIIRSEIANALPALLGHSIPISTQLKPYSLVVGTVQKLEISGINVLQAENDRLGDEGFKIQSQLWGSDPRLLITGNTETALLVGTFHFLRLIQTHKDIRELNISSHPRIQHRILAHWDNLDGSIERG